MEEYFAVKSAKDLASHLSNQVQAQQTFLRDVGLFDKWGQSYDSYYGRHFKNAYSDGTAIKSGGKQGEFKLLAINHYRNLLRHILIMTTSQRPAFDARAVNSDARSLMQAKLGNNILDSYMREKRLGRYLKKGAELGLVLGKGYLKCTWEPSLGKPYSRQPIAPKDGEATQQFKTIFEGDVDVSTHFPHDVFTDPGLEDFAKAQYVTVKNYKNRFDLAARNPDLAEKILQLPTKRDLDRKFFFNFQNSSASDEVEVFEFYHLRTQACPNGRYMLFGGQGGDCVMYDGPYPYGKRLPVFRIVPGEIVGTTEGYSDGFDLLAIQEAIDALASTIFTNQNAFGVQSVLVPEGCNLSVTQLANGLTMMKYNPAGGRPEPLQLTSTPKEVFEFLQMLERFAETISGVNHVARGNPETDMSGRALGLIQSMAIQYASGFQESWVELLEDAGTFILVDLLGKFAQTKRMIAIAGKSGKSYMGAFSKDDLADIDRVVVELGNPMARTTAGRVQMADSLLEKGLIKTPQEYTTVMNTGQLEPATQGSEAELALIHQENDDLLENKPVRGMICDSHLLHLQEHKVLFANPEVRRNPNMLAQAFAHYQWHIENYKQQDPLFAMIAGEPPAPTPMPMAPPGLGGGPQGAGGPPPQPPGPPGPPSPGGAPGGPAPAPPVPSQIESLLEPLPPGQPAMNLPAPNAGVG